MTDVQTLEGAARTEPMRPGCPGRREHEYIRHGTRTLIAKSPPAKCSRIAGADPRRGLLRRPHRADHPTNPDAGWLSLVGNLAIHESAAVVRLVAQCGLTTNLGVKGRSGALRSMATPPTTSGSSIG